METAERICKRFHSYLRVGEYSGRITAITGERLDVEASFGTVSVLNAGALQPFSCRISGVQPFTAMGFETGMDVLMDKKGIAVPDVDFYVDVTLAEDVDLSIECMVNLFLPVDLSIRARYIHRIIERCSANEDLSMLVIDPDSDPELQKLREPVRELSAAFFEQDEGHIQQAAANCSGFGSGIVPASDALLCGYMACFSCLSYALGRGRETVLGMTRAAGAGGAANTNENGAIALLQAGEGLVAEDCFQLLRSLFSDIPYTSITAWGNQMAKGPNGVNFLVGISIALHDLYLKNALS
ncbi:MAG: DUF2877 domain-containing protein [Clostridia bacterium]|jgi:hypothetical protein|nr:DUF2877 domain-containing protein [Clostridia bacterium]MBR0422911.1 DUF2877 domain-containing protein [Clostridia bacterium]